MKNVRREERQRRHTHTDSVLILSLIVALILGARVDPSFFLEFADSRGNTLLHLALIRNPQLSLLKWLFMKVTLTNGDVSL